MKTKKLLKTLDRLFGKKQKKLRKRHGELEQLLDELRGKQGRLRGRIQAEKDSTERDRLERKLRIIEAQIEKGAATLGDIRASFDDS